MEAAERELLVARILAGCLRCKVKTEECNKILVIKKPSLEQIYIAQELYHEYLDELIKAGGMSEEEVLRFMISRGLWSEQEEKDLETIKKQIDDFKVTLYNSTFKSNEKKTIRKALARAKEEVNKLTLKKQSYNYISNNGAASLLRSKYILAMSVYDLNGKAVFTEKDFWEDDSNILEQIYDFYFRSRIDEVTIRELCRTDPWRSIWNSRKSENSLFGIPTAELNDEQRNLVLWTGIYDSVYEHPETPPDSVIEDDDLLDGWMIIQRRKRKADIEKVSGENIVDNEKIRNSGEVFIPADTMDDAKKIAELNDDHADIVKRQRLNKVRRKGVVHEAEMPDSLLEIQQELNKQYIENARGKA